MLTPTEQCFEDALRTWEDGCLLREAALLTSRPEIPTDKYERYRRTARKWRDYRTVLLDNRIEQLEFEDWVVGSAKANSLLLPQGSATLYSFPIEYFAWSRKSRKVFAIEAREQEMFAQATFPDMRWGDVMWPFESFGIELATPVPILTGEVTYTCTNILVSQMWMGEAYAVNLRLLDGTGARPSMLPRDVHKRLRRAIDKGDHDVIVEVMQDMHERIPARWLCQGSINFVLQDGRFDAPETLMQLDEDGIAERLRSGNPQAWFNKLLIGLAPQDRERIGAIARVVVGTCLYLESISTVSPPTWEKRKMKGRGYVGPLGIITDEANVCRIIGRATIDPTRAENYSHLQAGSGFVRPHWRRAHRRRPPYTPPTHPKTIKLPPKLINEYLVPLFGVVSGSITRVLSEE